MARIAIVNRDDPFTVGMAQGIEDKRVHSFGQDEPTWVGDFGIVHEQELAWLATCDAHDGKVVARPLRDRGHMTRLLSLNKLRLRGRHNVMNVLAGLALGRAIDLPWDAMLHAIQDYAGEAHRLEFVYRIGRVDFFNDSKGTNVGATVAALEGLGQMAVLIVGGVGKGQNFSLLCPAVTRHARAVLFIGQDGPQIAQALTPSGVPCLPALDLAVAVRQAMKLAHPGDAVLLSPACASTDMFQHYAHRGQSFVQAVQALVLEKGAHA
jgi:UDP-N-acetylmuramoylalanine--D-glutamate ligase